MNIPIHSQVLHLDSAARTIIATLTADGTKAEKLKASGIQLLHCRELGGRIDLSDLFARLGEMGVQSVLLEGGSTLAGEAVRGGFVDKFMIFFGSKILGGEGVPLFAGIGAGKMAEAIKVSDLKIRRFGEDFLVEAYPEGTCLPG